VQARRPLQGAATWRIYSPRSHDFFDYYY